MRDSRRRDHYADSEWNSGWITKETPRSEPRTSAVEWVIYGLLGSLLVVVIVRLLKGIV